MNSVWSQAAKDYIKAHAGHMRDVDMLPEICRIEKRDVKLDALRKQRQRMGICKRRGRGVVGLDK